MNMFKYYSIFTLRLILFAIPVILMLIGELADIFADWLDEKLPKCNKDW